MNKLFFYTILISVHLSFFNATGIYSLKNKIFFMLQAVAVRQKAFLNKSNLLNFYLSNNRTRIYRTLNFSTPYHKYPRTNQSTPYQSHSTKNDSYITNPHVDSAHLLIRSSNNLKEIPENWNINDLAYILADEDAKKIIIDVAKKNISQIHKEFFNFLSNYSKNSGNIALDKFTVSEIFKISPEDYVKKILNTLSYDNQISADLMKPIVIYLNSEENVDKNRLIIFGLFLLDNIELFSKNFQINKYPGLLKHVSRNVLLHKIFKDLNIIAFNKQQIDNLLYLSLSDFNYFVWTISETIKNHRNYNSCYNFSLVLLERLEESKNLFSTERIETIRSQTRESLDFLAEKIK